MVGEEPPVTSCCKVGTDETGGKEEPTKVLETDFLVWD